MPLLQKSNGYRSITRIKAFLRTYPSFPYIIKWLLISLLTGICIGSASALFLQTLNWITDFRESHLWIIALLPLAGFIIGLTYHLLGKKVEAGNNLLIDTIHDPKE